MKRVAYKNLRPKAPPLCPISLRRILRACWQEPESARPPLTLVIQHLDLLESRIESLGSLAELRRVEAEDPAYKPELVAIEEERRKEAAEVAAAPPTAAETQKESTEGEARAGSPAAKPA